MLLGCGSEEARPPRNDSQLLALLMGRGKRFTETEPGRGGAGRRWEGASVLDFELDVPMGISRWRRQLLKGTVFLKYWGFFNSRAGVGESV